MSNPRNCKLVVLGDSGVGKTTLIHKYINKEFRADFKATIGADFSSQELEMNGHNVMLQIWDTAGEVRFHSVGAAFYRGTDACILVFDVTQRESFNRLTMWRDDLFSKSFIENTSTFPIIIFANKADLDQERQVTYEEAKRWADANHHELLEVSAKTGQNVEDGFKQIVKMYLDIVKQRIDEQGPISIKITNKKQNKKDDCGC